MIGFEINNQFLPLPPNARVGFRLSYKVDIGDKNIIPGSFSIPLTLQLNPTIRKLLQYPDRLDASAVVYKIPDCTFYAQGIPFKTGTLLIQGRNHDSVKISLIVTDVSDVKNKKMRQIDMGSVSTATSDDMRVEAYDTLVNPLDYQHAYIPVTNRAFTDEQNIYNTPFFLGSGTYEDLHWQKQNYLPPGSTSFGEAESVKIQTPHVRLDYTLSQIATALGYGIDNQWQTTDELKQIYIYSNNSVTQVAVPDNYQAVISPVYTFIKWPTTFAYNTQMPDMTISEVIKDIAKSQFLLIVFDTISRTMTVKTLESVVRAPIAHDWTDRHQGKHQGGATYNKYGRIAYDSVEDDLVPEYQATQIEHYTDTLLSPPTSINESDPTVVGFYYKAHYQQYLAYPTLDIEDRVTFRSLDQVEFDDTKDDTYYISNVPILAEKLDDVPSMACGIRGSGKFLVSEKRLDPLGIYSLLFWGEAEQSSPMSEIRLMMYRGIRDGHPFANPTTWDVETNNISHYDTSLLIDGDRGVYQRNQAYLDYINNKEEYTLVLHLTMKDLLNYNKGDKTRIQNQNYFIEELNLVFTHQGLDPVSVKVTTVV